SVFANSATHRNGESGYDLNRYYYISVKATVSALSFNVNLDPLAISVRIGEDGAIGLNVCIGYPVVVGLINGGGTLDISIRGDMIYLRRTQKTKATFGGLGSETLSSPIVLYRAMPLSVFADDIMNQLAWMLNLSDSIKNQMTNGSGSSGSTEKEIVDYGAILHNYISKIEYQAGRQEDAAGAYLRDNWTLTLNGSGISGGVMNEIIVKLLTDRSGSLSELNVETSVTYGITIGIKANMTYHNASERVNSPVDDITEDISYRLESGMSKAIREAAAADWKDAEGNVVFVEGQYTTLSYAVGDKTIATQHVVLNAQTGELYADLILPDLAPLTVAGYTVAWDLSAILQPDGSYRVTPEEIIQAKYTPNRYTVIFRSERPLPFFSEVSEYSAVDGKSYYVAVTTYVYNDGFYFADGTKFVFPDVDIEGWYVEAFCDSYGNAYGDFADCGEILSDLTLTAKWSQTEYTVVYEINGEKYEQKAHYGDGFVCPAETERRGYVFLGWLNGDVPVSAAQLETKRVEGNIRLVAEYEAEIYQIRLESEYRVDDSFFPENGVWVKTFDFIFGTQ
ncbi:MAG: InlB B-repeat-containing protein, partial [Clostridia bacterium]|nr:InlB B-repeat-containing protein [Clostridia bacterium]